MDSVRDDFYVDDEAPEELHDSLRSGTRVIVMPSSLRRNLRNRLSRMLRIMADDFGRAAERVASASRLRPGDRPRPVGRSRGSA